MGTEEGGGVESEESPVAVVRCEGGREEEEGRRSREDLFHVEAADPSL